MAKTPSKSGEDLLDPGDLTEDELNNDDLIIFTEGERKILSFLRGAKEQGVLRQGLFRVVWKYRKRFSINLNKLRTRGLIVRKGDRFYHRDFTPE